MKIKGIIDEDFTNYKKPAMYISFPHCTFKCCKECGQDICQNLPIVKDPDIEISVEDLVDRYLDNPITHAIVFAGLEPLCSFDDVLDFITELRGRGCNSDCVIYTGYNKEEIPEQLEKLSNFVNIIVKFGRFVPGTKQRFDEVLGVQLYEPQYAERL